MNRMPTVSRRRPYTALRVEGIDSSRAKTIHEVGLWEEEGFTLGTGPSQLGSAEWESPRTTNFRSRFQQGARGHSGASRSGVPGD
jgi:hypothetical protein